MPLLPQLEDPLPVPAPFCPLAPIPPVTHGELLHNRTNTWLDQSGMCLDESQRRRLTRVDVGHLTARGVPDGLLERTQVVSDVVMWLFAIDDHCDETELSHRPADYAALATKIQRVIEAPEVTGFDSDPYVASARDLRLRLEATGATPLQIMRWSYGIRMFLFGQVRECQARSQQIVPSLNEFMAMRLDTAGTLPVFALNDYARGYCLSSVEMNHPAVRALTEMGIMLIALDDEIVSFHKECHRSPDDLNLVGLIAHLEQVSPQEALDEAIAMRDKVMARFAGLGERCTERGSHELGRYIRALQTWVRAWMDWSYSVDRYTNPDAPADLTGGCTAERPAHSHQDIPLPSIAWWWDRAVCEERLPLLAGEHAG